jgi:hypothetical protein
MLRWLDSKITQWQRWYFRAFKMRSMPRLPDDFVRLLRAEYEAKKEQEKRQAERRNASLLDEGKKEESRQDEGRRDERDCIPRSWLHEKLSLQQAEADNAEGDLPFGRENDSWECLKASLQTADEIWSFCSPPESWEHCAGRSGVAIVREGRVVDCLVTMMN